MLLLMIKTKDDKIENLLLVLMRQIPQQTVHRIIDVPPVGKDFGGGGPRQQPARWPRVTRPQRLIIRVEQISEAFVELLISVQPATQDQRLEEPRGMRQMPLCRAGVVHRLDGLVLWREW